MFIRSVSTTSTSIEIRLRKFKAFRRKIVRCQIDASAFLVIFFLSFDWHIMTNASVGTLQKAPRLTWKRKWMQTHCAMLQIRIDNLFIFKIYWQKLSVNEKYMERKMRKVFFTVSNQISLLVTKKNVEAIVCHWNWIRCKMNNTTNDRLQEIIFQIPQTNPFLFYLNVFENSVKALLREIQYLRAISAFHDRSINGQLIPMLKLICMNCIGRTSLSELYWSHCIQ